MILVEKGSSEAIVGMDIAPCGRDMAVHAEGIFIGYFAAHTGQFTRMYLTNLDQDTLTKLGFVLEMDAKGRAQIQVT